LRPYLESCDWEQCERFEEKWFPVPELAQIGNGHITCSEIRKFLPPNMGEEFFTFCTVRNPFERFVSHCYLLYRHNEQIRKRPWETMKQTLRDARMWRIMRPQIEFITDTEGRILVDCIGRFENLQFHFEKVCKRIGVPAMPLPRVNATLPPPLRECLDTELTDMLRDYYARDFALFNYSTEIPEA
jgi:hypothetical protein